MDDAAPPQQNDFFLHISKEVPMQALGWSDVIPLTLRNERDRALAFTLNAQSDVIGRFLPCQLVPMNNNRHLCVYIIPVTNDGSRKSEGSKVVLLVDSIERIGQDLPVMFGYETLNHPLASVRLTIYTHDREVVLYAYSYRQRQEWAEWLEAHRRRNASAHKNETHPPIFQVFRETSHEGSPTQHNQNARGTSLPFYTGDFFFKFNQKEIIPDQPKDEGKIEDSGPATPAPLMSEFESSRASLHSTILYGPPSSPTFRHVLWRYPPSMLESFGHSEREVWGDPQSSNTRSDAERMEEEFLESIQTNLAGGGALVNNNKAACIQPAFHRPTAELLSSHQYPAASSTLPLPTMQQLEVVRRLQEFTPLGTWDDIGHVSSRVFGETTTITTTSSERAKGFNPFQSVEEQILKHQRDLHALGPSLPPNLRESSKQVDALKQFLHCAGGDVNSTVSIANNSLVTHLPLPSSTSFAPHIQIGSLSKDVKMKLLLKLASIRVSQNGTLSPRKRDAEFEDSAWESTNLECTLRDDFAQGGPATRGTLHIDVDGSVLPSLRPSLLTVPPLQSRDKSTVGASTNSSKFASLIPVGINNALKEVHEIVDSRLSSIRRRLAAPAL